MKAFTILQASISFVVFATNAFALNIPDAVITITSTLTSTQITTPPPVVTVTVTATPPATVAPSLGQCGGEQYTGPTRCQNGEICVVVDKNYSHCVRDTTTTITSFVTTTTTRGDNPIPGTTSGYASDWDQCGGPQYRGSTQCAPGSQCVYINSSWSQCRKIGYNPAPQPNGIVGIWDQCGGAAWDGNTRCEAGSQCVYRAQYFSQCRPTP